MSDRERLVEVMARAAYQACRDWHQLTPNYQWETETEDGRDLWRDQQRDALAAAERAGFLIVAPDDGR